MDTKHTPGPWRIDVNGSEDWSVDYDGPSSTYMTICGTRPQPVCFAVEPSAYGNDEEVEANARIIAAAPELLEALIEMVRLAGDGKHFDDSLLSDEGQALFAAKAIIAKATQP